MNSPPMSTVRLGENWMAAVAGIITVLVLKRGTVTSPRRMMASGAAAWKTIPTPIVRAGFAELSASSPTPVVPSLV